MGNEKGANTKLEINVNVFAMDIEKAINRIRIMGREPDVMIMHPYACKNLWAEISGGDPEKVPLKDIKFSGIRVCRSADVEINEIIVR